MDNKELNHAGIKGMKWGVRRYQNADGSLTPAGKKRYQREDRKAAKAVITDDIKNAAKAGSNLKLARRELSTIEKKLERQSEKNTRDLTIKRNLLKEYVEDQKYRNDFSVKNAERTNELLSKYSNMKPRDIPIETTKSGERFVIDRSSIFVGPYISGLKRVVSYKKDIKDYAAVKLNGYNPNSNWKQLYKDYGLKYPGKL